MEEIQILRTDYGSSNAHRQVVIRARCPFCQDKVTFKQLDHSLLPSRLNGHSVALQCEGCLSLCTYSAQNNALYPALKLKGIEGLPEEISKYYQEAIRCLESKSPNGAVTLFRKTIHALGINYGLATKNDSKGLYEIIKELHTNDHIVQKLRDALLSVKDIGNDGAHINDNEPDMDQANHIWQLMDTVLNSTVIADASLELLRTRHAG